MKWVTGSGGMQFGFTTREAELHRTTCRELVEGKISDDT